MPRSATPRKRDFVATHTGTGFVGGLVELLGNPLGRQKY